MPIAFLVVGAQGVKMLHLDQNTHLIEKIMDVAPGVVEKIQGMLKQNGQNAGGQNGGQQPANQQKQDLDF